MLLSDEGDFTKGEMKPEEIESDNQEEEEEEESEGLDQPDGNEGDKQEENLYVIHQKFVKKTVLSFLIRSACETIKTISVLSRCFLRGNKCCFSLFCICV